ncbi:TolC family protein [bacterium]|nr:TolC family protein [bacterium]
MGKGNILLNDDYGRASRLLVGRIIDAIALGVVGSAMLALPVLATPADAQDAANPASARPVTLSASYELDSGYGQAEARGGVLNEGIPSIENHMAPVWEWSQQRLDRLSKQYRDAELTDDNVLTLAEAEKEALANDHGLKATRYSAKSSHYAIKQAEANLYPTIGLSGNLSASGTLNDSSDGTYVDTNGGAEGIVKISTGTNVRSNLGVQLSLSQTLYDYSRKRRIRRAELNEVAALANYESQRLDTILALRKAWFAAYSDQVNLDVMRETVDNRRLRLKQAQGLYEGGTKARIDVATAESDLSQAELKVISQETRLAEDWIALNTAMGKPSHRPYRLVLDPYWDRGIDLTEAQMVSVALSCRAELLAMQAQLKAQLCAMELADADRYPSLRASAGISESGSLTPFDGTWNVGVSLNWNLFDGFLSKYEKLSAQAVAYQLAEQFEQKRLSIYSEVMSKSVLMRQAAAGVEAAKSGVAKAKESYRLASARYRVGVGQAVEVSDAEVALAEAQLSYVTAANTYHEAKAELLRAIGVDDLDNLPEGLEPVELDAIPDVPGGEE